MRFLWLFLIIGTLFVACGGEEEVAGSECITKEDCTAPLVCVNGFCKAEDNGDAECTTSQECPFGEECVNFKCVEISGDTTGDTSADTSGDTTGDTGNSANTGDTANSGDSGDSADTTPDTADTATDNTIIPDEESDEIPDEDVDGGETACVNTGECSETTVCIATLCRDPFSARWRIGDISLTVSRNGDDWDLLGNDPDPFVHLYMNGTEMFKTDTEDDSYTAVYPDHFDTYLLPTDVLQFLVIDEDPAGDTNGDDDIADITIDHIDPRWLHNGSYSVPAENYIDILIIHFDMIN